jgi:hypothetical protein
MRDFSFVNIPAVKPLSIRKRPTADDLIRERYDQTVHSLLCRPLRTGFDVTDTSFRRDCDSGIGGLMRLRRQQKALDSAAEMRGSHLEEISGRSAAWILLIATVRDMSSRANSCIANMKLEQDVDQ